MLLLRRKIGRSIIIGDNIVVTVTGIEKHLDGTKTVELGVEAPRHVCIDRKEIRDKRVSNIDGIKDGFNTKNQSG